YRRRDLEGPPIGLLEGDALGLPPDLLVEVEAAADPAGRREAPIHLLVGGEDALQAVTDAVARCTGLVHRLPAGGLTVCNSSATELRDSPGISTATAAVLHAWHRHACIIARA